MTVTGLVFAAWSKAVQSGLVAAVDIAVVKGQFRFLTPSGWSVDFSALVAAKILARDLYAYSGERVPRDETTRADLDEVLDLLSEAAEHLPWWEVRPW